jgi:hypothetical protein
MPKHVILRSARLLALSALITTPWLTGCQTTSPAPDASAGPAAEASVQPHLTDAQVAEQYGGDGMMIPLDGSSLEAFESSLASVQRHSSESKYTTLTNAIDYLLLYDLGAGGDRAKLAQSLDGMNGEQVIRRVSWQKK